MFSKALFLVMIPIVTANYLNIPDNIDFDINYYNSSNCTQPFKTTVLKSLCYKSNVMRGYPQCCQDMLDEVSIFPNTSFNVCSPVQISNTNITHIIYNCNTSNMRGIDNTEALAYFGMASVFMFGFIIITLLSICCYRMCCRNKYSRI